MVPQMTLRYIFTFSTAVSLTSLTRNLANFLVSHFVGASLLVGSTTVVRGSSHTIACTFTTTIIAQLPLLEFTRICPVPLLLLLLQVPPLRSAHPVYFEAGAFCVDVICGAAESAPDHFREGCHVVVSVPPPM